jgi:hypothetical protein
LTDDSSSPLSALCAATAPLVIVTLDQQVATSNILTSHRRTM